MAALGAGATNLSPLPLYPGGAIANIIHATHDPSPCGSLSPQPIPPTVPCTVIVLAGPGGRTIRGDPMAEALYRTNHGFAAPIVSHYMWNTTNAYVDSDHRYHLIAERLRAYSQSGRKANATAAVHLTSLAAQKGPDYDACTAPFGPQHGENVLSVATDPTSLVAYAAWEDGKGFGSAPGNWRPAGCNAYLEIDLKRWF